MHFASYCMRAVVYLISTFYVIFYVCMCAGVHYVSLCVRAIFGIRFRLYDLSVYDLSVCDLAVYDLALYDPAVYDLAVVQC